jgi:hypothetical protein
MKATPELERMLPRDIPEGSRTYHAYRMAFQNEYMVPIEHAWAFEQEINALTIAKYKAEGRLRAWREIAVGLYFAEGYGTCSEKELAFQKLVSMLQIEALETKLKAADSELAKLKEAKS